MDRRPNFIVIHTDQHRGDCLGFLHQRKHLYTPNLDSIADQGAYFSNGYAGCPVCIPQRLTLLTGQTAARHGVMDNLGIPYMPLETTLPTEMHRSGYQTALVGRTMHTYPYTHPYGFEYYKPGDLTNNLKDKDEFFKFIRENAPPDNQDYYGGGACLNSNYGVPFHMEDRFHHTMWTTNRALDFMDNRDNSRPFMLFVGYFGPHTPLNPPSEYFHRYYDNNDPDAPYIADYDVEPVSNGCATSNYINLEGEQLRTTQAAYYGSISFIDAQIGRILDKLIYMPNTYVIVTSDHGELLGDHYSMQKSKAWQGSVHIPFLVYGPGIKGKQKFVQPVGWEDIMPTILELADTKIPDSVEGMSLASLLKSGKDDSLREYFHGECSHFNPDRYGGYEDQQKDNNFVYEVGSQYLTDGKMKYIWYETSGKEQLFDLTNDYGEVHDLSELTEFAEVLKKWRQRLVEELKGRPEGFTDGEKLICGRKPFRLQPNAQKVADERKAESYDITYDYPTILPLTRTYTNSLN